MVDIVMRVNDNGDGLIIKAFTVEDDSITENEREYKEKLVYMFAECTKELCKDTASVFVEGDNRELFEKLVNRVLRKGE